MATERAAPSYWPVHLRTEKIAPLAGAVVHHPAVKKHIDHIFKRAGYNPDDVRDRDALIQSLDRYEPCGLPLAAQQNIIRQESAAAKAAAAAWPIRRKVSKRVCCLSRSSFAKSGAKKLYGYGPTVKPDTPMIFLWGP